MQRMNKQSKSIFKLTVLVLIALSLACVLTACNEDSKKRTVTFIGVCEGHRIYSQEITYKTSQQAYFEPTEVVGYEFEKFEGAPAATQIELTRELDKRTVKVVYTPQFSNLPVVWVETLGSAAITGKEDYTSCGVSILNTDEKYRLDDVPAGIRGRGNTSWGFDKKPYRIKFDKKQGLFGLEKNKSWVLLAMYQDFSGIKDYAAFSLARSIDGRSAFVPNGVHVELYFNGRYGGLYLLTDQVQESSGRVGVEADITEEDIEVPFLVELDEYAPDEGKENVDWFRVYNKDSKVTSYYSIKYPEKDERMNGAQFDYIKNYVTKVNALCHDKNVTRAEFEEYVDLNAFIDFYLVQEIMGQIEINWKSVYMSKKVGGKLIMGPVWDFDWSAGGAMADGGNASPEVGLYSKSNWFYFMLKVDWFKQACLSRLEELKPGFLAALDGLAAYKEHLTAAAERNEQLWHFNGRLPHFDEYYDTVLGYIQKRIQLLPNFINQI